jgi:hypothetical protein
VAASHGSVCARRAPARAAFAAAAAASPPPPPTCGGGNNDRNARWQLRFDELKAYAAAHGGDTCVPKEPADDKFNALGRWVAQQRFLRKSTHGTLSSARIAALDAIGFVWNVNDAQWQQHLQELAAHKAAYGHVNIPSRGAGGALGLWLCKVRENWRNGYLSPERAAKLTALGVAPEKQMSDASHKKLHAQSDAAWREKLAQLQAYADAHGGSTAVPQRFKDNPSLGGWVTRQRHFRKKGKLSDEKVAALDALGFDWERRAGRRR